MSRSFCCIRAEQSLLSEAHGIVACRVVWQWSWWCSKLEGGLKQSCLCYLHLQNAEWVLRLPRTESDASKHGRWRNLHSTPTEDFKISFCQHSSSCRWTRCFCFERSFVRAAERKADYQSSSWLKWRICRSLKSSRRDAFRFSAEISFISTNKGLCNSWQVN